MIAFSLIVCTFQYFQFVFFSVSFISLWSLLKDLFFFFYFLLCQCQKTSSFPFSLSLFPFLPHIFTHFGCCFLILSTGMLPRANFRHIVSTTHGFLALSFFFPFFLTFLYRKWTMVMNGSDSFSGRRKRRRGGEGWSIGSIYHYSNTRSFFHSLSLSSEFTPTNK